MAEDPDRSDGAAVATACRGVRGATTVDPADPGDVEGATAELLDALLRANAARLQDVAAAIFTLTDDLAGLNPAAAARANGWGAIPLLVVREHAGENGVPRCLRVLLLVNTDRPQAAIAHLYLRGATALRPDLAALP